MVDVARHGESGPNERTHSVQEENSFEPQGHLMTIHAEATLNINRIIRKEIDCTICFSVNVRNLTIGSGKEHRNSVQILSYFPMTFVETKKMNNSQGIRFNVDITQPHLVTKHEPHR